MFESKYESNIYNRVYDEVKENLTGVNNKLSNASASFEEDFTKTGKKLFVISEKANKISGVATEVAEFMVGKNSSDLILELQTKLKNIDRYFSYSLQNIIDNKELLKKIQKNFRLIEEPFENFKRIIKHFKVLSISIRIESARLNSENNKFDVLADDVNKLSEFAEEKVKEITDSIKNANALMELLFLKVEELLTDKYLKARDKLNPIMDLFESFWENQKKSSVASAEIATRMKENSKRINEIVVSLQTNDIARQKLEHVIEVFNEYINFFPEEDPESLRSYSTELYNKSTLQVNQIIDARNRLINSVQRVKDGLLSISENTDNITGETKILVQISETESSALLDESGKKMEEITGSLFGAVKAQLDISESMKKTLSIVENMNKTLSSINDLDTNIKLMSFNGIVHASRLGQEGAALSVIADSIQRLADDSQKQIGEFTSLLIKIGRTADYVKLGVFSGDGEEGINGIVSKISDDLGSFFKRLNENNNQLKERVMKFNSFTGEFNSELNQSIDIINVDTNIKSTMDYILNDINEMMQKLDRYCDCSKQKRLSTSFDELKNNYTMESERLIHDQTVNGTFDSYGSNYTNDDTDDNIELF